MKIFVRIFIYDPIKDVNAINANIVKSKLYEMRVVYNIAEDILFKIAVVDSDASVKFSFLFLLLIKLIIIIELL